MSDLQTNSVNILLISEKTNKTIELCELLEIRQYQLVKCNTAKDGIDTALKKIPDLILVNMVLTDLDGFQTIRKLRENQALKELPIILLATTNDRSDFLKAFEAGANDYIAENLNIHDVIIRIINHLKFQALLQDRNELLSLLQEYMKKTKAISENVEHGLCTLTPLGNIESINNKGAELFNKKPSEIIGKPLDSFIDVKTCKEVIEYIQAPESTLKPNSLKVKSTIDDETLEFRISHYYKELFLFVGTLKKVS